MLSFAGVSTWIEVDGKELEQYGVEEDPGHNQVTCWIAAQLGKGFSIVFRDNMAYREHSIASFLQLDGTSVAGKLLQPIRAGAPNTGNRTIVQSGRTLSATSSLPFLFSKLELTDDDEYLNQSSTRLGEIRISIYRVQVIESALFQSSAAVSGHGKVHERSKKAITHCVSYGQEVKTETQYSCRVRYLDGNNPLATFVFNYRDLGLLQANGIIPKPPPVKKEAAPSREVLDLTRANNSGVKREPVNEEIEIIENTTERKAPKRVNPSREGEAQPAKKIKREKGIVPIGDPEIIDLT